jgi:large subunit ribosomal protein L23
MALFSRTSKETQPKPKAVAEAAPKAARIPAMKADHAHVLLNPRITEKATFASSVSAYVFDVAVSANKKQIMAAVQAVYNVKPRQVRIVNIRPKTVRNMRTGKSGKKSGGKKAYVYLTKGETITIA